MTDGAGAVRPTYADGGDFRWRHLLTAPRAVWLLVAAFAFLLALSTVVHPPYRGPDEPQHVDLVTGVAQGLGPLGPQWAPNSRQVSEGVFAGVTLPNSRMSQPQHLADRAPIPRSQRPTYAGLGGATPMRAPNQLVQHPPLFYLVEAGVLRLMPDWPDQPFDRVVFLLRLVAAAMVAPLPLLAFACARRISRSPLVPLLAALAVLGVPQLLHISSSVNNDSLQNLAGGVLLVLLAYVATGDRSVRTALAVGAALGVGLLTKGLLLLFIPLLPAAYLLAWRRHRGPLRQIAVPALTALAVAAAVGGWWWVRNVMLFGAVQPAGYSRPQEVVRGLGSAATTWAGNFAYYVDVRYWFDTPGGPATPAAAGLAVGATVLVLLLVIAALGRRSRGTTSRGVLLLLVAPTVLLLVTLFRGSWVVFRLGYDQPALQGRYLFPGLVGVAAVVAIGLVGTSRLRGVRQGVGLVAALGSWCVITQLLALVQALRLYYWPQDNRVTALVRGLLDIAPWPAPVSVVVTLAGLVVTVLAGVELVREGRRVGSVSAHQVETVGVDAR